jgi:hypothetical protein
VFGHTGMDGRFQARVFISCDRLALDAEYLEKIIEEALGFALFIVGIGPFFRKRLGASFDFIPAQTQIISPAM